MVSGGSIAGTGESFTTPPLTGPTSYYVEAVNGGCVSVRSEVTVTPYEKVDKPDISATTSASNVITFSWDAVPDATGYLVSVNGGAYTNPSSGPKGTTHTVSGGTDSVTLTVIALGALNCENNQGSYTVKLKVSPVFIPNAFTPNGDGLNDVFRVEGNSIATVEMMVFDQWGELLFKGIQWDGRHGGKEQPSGVYMYTVKVVQNDKTVIEKKGAVNLLR
jgi:gliding motility-associated-like protein